MAKLTDDQVQDGLAALVGWRREGDEIVRDLECATFPGAIELVGRIAELAESANHHPDIDIRYNRLRVALTTHDAGGLTQRDLDLAARIDTAAEGA